MITVGDLFAGGGGVTEGAKLAGLEVVFAANHWRLAVDHHARMHPKCEHVCQDLNQFDFRLMPRVDILWASPSCQGHSEAAQPARAVNPDLACAHDYLRTSAWAVVEAVTARQPRAFVVENVREFREWAPPPRVLADGFRTKSAAVSGLRRFSAHDPEAAVHRAGRDHWQVVRRAPKGSLYKHWLRTFALSGYRVTEQLLTASKWSHGGRVAPQRRTRLFLVGHLDKEVEIDEPEVSRDDEPTLEPVLDFDDGPWTPIDDISRPGARRRVEHAHEVFGGRPCWGFHASHKGAWARQVDQPANTVTTQNQHYKVADGRYQLWSVEETSQVMGFERDYFDGVGRTDALVMAGNAVPPPMAAGILAQVAESLG